MIGGRKHRQVTSTVAVILAMIVSGGCISSSSVTVQFEKGLKQAIERTRSSVVSIEVFCNDSCFCGDDVTARGAGVIIDDQGLIATTYEFLSKGDRFRALFQDGCSVEAVVSHFDRETNVALLTTPQHPCGCFPIHSGGNKSISTGSLGIIVNNSAFSKGVSAGLGIIAESWLGGDDRWSNPLQIIQTGDILTTEGAPVMSLDGDLIGIIDAMIESHNGSWTVIPAQTIIKVANELKDHGSISRSWMGISCSEELLELKSESGVKPYVRINKIIEGSPAEKAGLSAGDFVTSFNKQPIVDIERLRKEVTSLAIDSKAELGVISKSGDQKSVEVTTVIMPVETDRPRLCSTRTL